MRDEHKFIMDSNIDGSSSHEPLQEIPEDLLAAVVGGAMSGYLKIKKLNSGE